MYGLHSRYILGMFAQIKDVFNCVDGPKEAAEFLLFTTFLPVSKIPFCRRQSITACTEILQIHYIV
jgi:hypothetical protein